MTALFENIIFGPIHSRRLGLSLGVNLLPQHAKICNFNCIYCECGSNEERVGDQSQRRFAKREDVSRELRKTLIKMAQEGTPPDVITFAGNGEPTLHPDFEAIIHDTISLRDELTPSAKISVLSNATTLSREGVVRALRLVDNNILKLDSVFNDVARAINRPNMEYDTERIIEQIAQFEGEAIVQTMFLRGEVDGVAIDNTQPAQVARWLDALRRINPRSVMIYSLDRDTPCSNLERVSREELKCLAAQVEAIGNVCITA